MLSLPPSLPPSYTSLIFLQQVSVKLSSMAANFLFLPFLPLPTIIIIILFLAPSSCHGGYWPPSPGYYPGSKFRSYTFNQGFKNIWGPSHQSVDNNGLRIWLDTNSGDQSPYLFLFSSLHFYIRKDD